MASIRSFFSSFIILFSLLLIASATDYEYGPKPTSLDLKLKSELNVDYMPKSETLKKPTGEYVPTSQSNNQTKYNGEYVPKSVPEISKKPYDVHVPKPELGTPEKPSDEYVPKPKPVTPQKFSDEHVSKTKSETPKKPDNVYVPKPESETPKKPDDVYVSETPKKPTVVYVPDVETPTKPNDVYIPKPKWETPKKADDNHVTKPELEKPDDVYAPNTESDSSKKPNDEYVPKFDSKIPKKTNGVYDLKPDFLPIGIEGLVLCKSGSKYIPIKGAVARITCSIVGHDGYEAAPFSCLTSATDEKGYFFKTLADLGVRKMLMLTDCKVKLEKSPLESCNVPTNVNRGITGALLSSYQILHDKKIKLYPVGPFFYTSHHDIPSYPQPTPTPY